MSISINAGSGQKKSDPLRHETATDRIKVRPDERQFKQIESSLAGKTITFTSAAVTAVGAGYFAATFLPTAPITVPVVLITLATTGTPAAGLTAAATGAVTVSGATMSGIFGSVFGGAFGFITSLLALPERYKP